MASGGCGLSLEDLGRAWRRHLTHRVGGFAPVDGGAVSEPLLRSLLGRREPLPKKVRELCADMGQTRKNWDGGATALVLPAAAAAAAAAAAPPPSLCAAQSPWEPTVDLRDLLTALALLAADGSVRDRLLFVFGLFDADGTGAIGREALEALLESLGRALCRLQLALPFEPHHVQAVARSCFAFKASGGRSQDFKTEKEEEESAVLVYRAAVHGAPLSAEDLVTWATSDPLALRLTEMAAKARRHTLVLALWTRRALRVRDRLDARAARPDWAIGSLGGGPGTEGAVAAGRRGRRVAADLFAVPPLVLLLAGPAPALGLAFQTRREARVFLHVDDGSGTSNKKKGVRVLAVTSRPGRPSLVRFLSGAAASEGGVVVSVAVGGLAGPTSRAEYAWSAVVKWPPASSSPTVAATARRLLGGAGAARAVDADVLLHVPPSGAAPPSPAALLDAAGVMRGSPDPRRGDGYDVAPLHVIARDGPLGSFPEGGAQTLRVGDTTILRVAGAGWDPAALNGLLRTVGTPKCLVVASRPLCDDAAADDHLNHDFVAAAAAADSGRAADQEKKEGSEEEAPFLDVAETEAAMVHRRARGFALGAWSTRDIFGLEEDEEPPPAAPDDSHDLIVTPGGAVLGRVRSSVTTSTRRLHGALEEEEGEAPPALAPVEEEAAGAAAAKAEPPPPPRQKKEEVPVGSNRRAAVRALIDWAEAGRREVAVVCASAVADTHLEHELREEAPALEEEGPASSTKKKKLDVFERSRLRKKEAVRAGRAPRPRLVRQLCLASERGGALGLERREAGGLVDGEDEVAELPADAPPAETPLAEAPAAATATPTQAQAPAAAPAAATATPTQSPAQSPAPASPALGGKAKLVSKLSARARKKKMLASPKKKTPPVMQIRLVKLKPKPKPAPEERAQKRARLAP